MVTSARAKIHAESPLEEAIVEDPRWRTGIDARATGPGHPEPTVGHHVLEVLANVDRVAGGGQDLRRRLRLIAIVHDTFKAEAKRAQAAGQAIGHGEIACEFASAYIADDGVLQVILLHDEAYAAWEIGAREGDWEQAEAHASELIRVLGRHLPLYLAFYRCDAATGTKVLDHLEWFERQCIA